MRESGQTVVEWLAVLAGVVTLAGAGAVALPSVAPAMTGGMQTVICRVTGGRACGDGPATSAPRAQVAPFASPAAPNPPAAGPAPAAPPAATPAAPPAATPAAPARDLCGSSYFNVPELWFTSACEGHDRCYGAHRGKAACDTAFLDDMLAICAKLPASGSVNANLSRASCRAAAHLYYKGVVVGGGFSYCHRPVCREE
jgi:hypothetical protein